MRIILGRVLLGLAAWTPVGLVFGVTHCDRTRTVLAPTDAYPASPEGVCAHLAELGCPEAQVAPDGTSCPMVIRQAQKLVDMRLSCLAEASTVDDLRACRTVRCQP